MPLAPIAERSFALPPVTSECAFNAKIQSAAQFAFPGRWRRPAPRTSRSIVLDQQKILYDAGKSIDAVYFPTGAIVSLVIGLSTGEMVEAAMVGRDGVVGARRRLTARSH